MVINTALLEDTPKHRLAQILFRRLCHLLKFLHHLNFSSVIYNRKIHLTFSSNCQSTSNFSSRFFQTCVENMLPFCSHSPSQPETLQLWAISEITAPAWHLHLLDGFIPQFLTPDTLYYNIPWAVTCHVPFGWKVTQFPVILEFALVWISHPIVTATFAFEISQNPVGHRLVSSLWCSWETMEILGGGAVWKEVRSFGECLWKGILWQWSLLLLSFASQQPWCEQSPPT